MEISNIRFYLVCFLQSKTPVWTQIFKESNTHLSICVITFWEELKGKTDPNEIKNSVKEEGRQQKWMNMKIFINFNFIKILVEAFVFHRTWNTWLNLNFAEI